MGNGEKTSATGFRPREDRSVRIGPLAKQTGIHHGWVSAASEKVHAGGVAGSLRGDSWKENRQEKFSKEDGAAGNSEAAEGMAGNRPEAGAAVYFCSEAI